VTEEIFQQMLQFAAKITNPVTAAVFVAGTLCIVLSLVIKTRQKQKAWILVMVFGVGIIFLGALPLLAKTYLDTHGVYEIRVVVLGPDRSPVDGAVVVCSPGGEQKSIAGGWECDVPPRIRPADGVFSAYASVKSAFLAGKGQLNLSDDYNPILTIQLERDLSATVRGEVQDRRGHALPEVYVTVVGNEFEGVKTGSDGGFRLRAHAANGQMIRLHAEARNYKPYNGLQQAGDDSISIQLER
jgi:hypothetical protein